jgi:hypothetical protein
VTNAFYCRQNRFMSVTGKLLVSATFLLEALFVYFVLTQRYPISGDDYSYLYQAKLFASGKLYAEDPVYDPGLPFYDCVATYCLRDDQGHRFSKYPPGWPALLAVGVKLRVPWLINPLLGALLVFLMLEYTERRISKEQVRVACLLLLPCFFLCYYAASFRPHIAGAVFVFAAFLLYDAAERESRLSKVCLFGAGAILGYSTMIRYVDWIPLAVWIGTSLLGRKKLMDLVLFGIGLGMLASGNLIYNALLSGNPFLIPAAIHGSATNDRLMISWSGFAVTIVRLANLLWVFPPAALLVVYWKHYSPSSRIKTYVGLFAIVVGVYFFYPVVVGGPGPRYFLVYFPFLVLAVVDLYRSIRHDSLFAVRHVWIVAIAGLIIGNLVFAAREGYTMYWRRDLDRTARNVRDEKTIFLLKTGTYKTARGDLTRNPPELSSAARLYFSWCDQPKRDALLRHFPGRTIFVYEYPAHLERLSE